MVVVYRDVHHGYQHQPLAEEPGMDPDVLRLAGAVAEHPLDAPERLAEGVEQRVARSPPQTDGPILAAPGLGWRILPQGLPPQGPGGPAPHP